jgi:hypothetical protein
MDKIFVLVDETIDGVMVVFASADKEACIYKLKTEYPSLHYVGGDIWRCGSSIITIQQVDVG